MKKFNIEFRWSMVFFLASLLWLYFEKSMGWHGEHISKHPIYRYLFGIIAIPIYIFALKNKRNDYFDGQMSWKQGFLSGAILSLFIAGLTPIIQYILNTYISPNYLENIIALAVENGIEQQMAKNVYSLSNYILQETFANLSYGIVTAAAVSWFIKTDIKKSESAQ